MKILWHGHSCFEVVTRDGTVVLDPYGDGTVPGYGPLALKADQVLCSHEHGDHNNRAGITLSGSNCGVDVEMLASFHDDAKGAKRGRNLIYILSAEGMRVAHLGDLGCELNESQIELLKGVDVLMIPIGGFYTIDTEQALEIVAQLEPRVTIPMHYRDETHGFDVISTAELFRQRAYHPVDIEAELEVDPSTERQTAFMKPM